ncbi:hypothetical protein SAMN05421803_11889 [Nocardiopsis flavescens]|uniref:Uncharacterized protein n=1 Tax=Nocardiopsis flavescens TaxID=758803 RepID=A0A1M6RWT9_9ACTN|nr:hypothetical protein [Nocardiopsis flavescens]SHK36778.1 hypothetical protein SAMN05421803_11889 [Nocardiopsis flavescens]
MSRDLRDDRSPGTVEAAEAAIGTEAAETDRRGAAETVGPAPYADTAAAGADLPSAFGHPYSAVGDPRVRHPAGTGRRPAPAAVQDDAELPFVLYDAVGDGPFPEPPAPPDAPPRLTDRPRRLG